jgi:uncharacterized repeat protein (TIGR03803 family)
MTRTGQHQHRRVAIRWLGASGALTLGAMFVTAVTGTLTAQAQTYTVLHRFKGYPTDGDRPAQGRLIGDSTGKLYGATQNGGASDAGVVFKLDKTGETVLYSFTGGKDGAYPKLAGRDPAGNLYGATPFGGASDYGVVFKLDTTGTETVLYSFTGGKDGASPYAGVIRDSTGDLYGTTAFGGSSGAGVVFELDTTGTETVLYSFTGLGDGGTPIGGLDRDSAGNLYSTTVSGGASGDGVVFKLDTTGAETVLHSFTGADGANPDAGVIRDAAGNLYGTTVSGGASGYGTVFKLDTGGTETVLYSFKGGADGSGPEAGLIRDPAGNLYGTTYGGGTCCGVIFKVDTAGTETVLYSFSGGADGAYPAAGLIKDAAGNLYGTTYSGGITQGNCALSGGCGVVFMLEP